MAACISRATLSRSLGSFHWLGIFGSRMRGMEGTHFFCFVSKAAGGIIPFVRVFG